MRRARLLHSAEEVEVLQVDQSAGVAIIRRHGFEQRVSLEDIVYESEKPLSAEIPRGHPPPQTSILELYPRLAEKVGELRLYHGQSNAVFYMIYIQTPQKTWMPLLNRLLGEGESLSVSISMETYPFPWRILLRQVEVPHEAVSAPPPLQSSEITIRLSMLTRGEPQRLFPKEENCDPEELTSDTISSLRPVKPGPQIDLHIEALAPHLQGAPAEAIYDHQISCMQRYLYACEAAGQSSAIVIHGVGKKRLHAALVNFCKEQGWRVETLLLPPYLGGASRVYFSK
ncbi:MAG: hypothetical protein N2253_06830 [Bacteroidia bacterium]|nr:hypothetical protein [Bacteroidia bacterium]MCX7764588.1 hypothetical protein [Bacteroidia bacterium]MDW8056823.1 hypothetical protein [Bacteroidia bacterium]